MNIFKGWIFLKGEYFSGVNIFQRWIFFRSESFSGVNIFQGWIYLGWIFLWYEYLPVMSLVHSLLGLVVPTVSFYHGMQKACTKISCPWKCIFVEGMKPIFALAVLQYTSLYSFGWDFGGMAIMDLKWLGWIPPVSIPNPDQPTLAIFLVLERKGKL